MNKQEFSSEEELLKFAHQFLSRHLRRFRKDIKICLTANEQAKHAYFPCLMTCIGFFEFLGGLYGGNIDDTSLDDLKSYSGAFLPQSYSHAFLEILYKCFRHKIAHLAHPYDVLVHSGTTGKMRIAWTITESQRPPAIRIRDLSKAKPLRTAPQGWGITYDHVAYIRLGCLADDIAKTVFSSDGYFSELKKNPDRQKKFQKCTKQYFKAEVT